LLAKLASGLLCSLALLIKTKFLLAKGKQAKLVFLGACFASKLKIFYFVSLKLID